jgi:anti-sigma factor RsiW
MIQPAADDGRHMEDGDVIRLLDGECSQEEARLFHAHLHECDECRCKMDELCQLSQDFSCALQLEDQPATPRDSSPPEVVGKIRPSVLQRHWSRWRVTRAAAAIVILTAALSATPARAWLAERWDALKSLVVGAPAEQPEAVPAPIEPRELGPVITFTPAGPEFTLRIVHVQAGGTLYLTVDPTASASAGVIGGDGSEEIVVLPDGFQIRNAATSTASYEVRLPSHLETLEVHIGDRTELRLDLTAQAGPIRRDINLSGADPGER